MFRLYLNKELDEGVEPDFVLIAESSQNLNKQSRQSDQRQLAHFVDNDHDGENEQNHNENILLPVLHGHHVYGSLIIEHGIDFYAEMHSNVILSAITIFSNQMSLLQNSSQDALTGLFNRYMLDNAMEHILSVSQARREDDNQDNRWCLAMLDIDHFKAVNDTYGHLIGDEVLLKLAQLMKKCFRHEDMLFRFGGEEFSILLKGVDLEQATNILERFRTTISDFRFPQVGQVTVSLGLTFMTPGKFPSALLGNADKALYYSKEHGRNQLHCFERLHELNLLEEISTDNNDLEFF
ncbi:MAG: GGDEF domain-containing protein [Algicola sp.]|nr:GGDEF domain-containing protein [Algicola sp.]